MYLVPKGLGRSNGGCSGFYFLGRIKLGICRLPPMPKRVISAARSWVTSLSGTAGPNSGRALFFDQADLLAKPTS